MKSVDEKYQTIVSKNTFYFFNPIFEEKYEGYLNSIKETLLVLKNEVENDGLKKEHFERLIAERQHGLRALLALTGFSNEYFKRLTTVIRVVDDIELSKLVYKDKWHKKECKEEVGEWSDGKILKMIKTNEYFRKGIVNIFFEGSTIPFLPNTIPLFELKKLSISKLKFDIPAMIDTLVRYKEKGSYSGIKEKNTEVVIENLLKNIDIPYEKGDLCKFITDAPNTKRSMDIVIPNKNDPKIIIESSFLMTTSSGQGDKSKTEIAISSLLKKYYPKAKFIGFIDGIGWYVRKGDLKRMVVAFEDVFTFQKDELERFKQFMIQESKNDR